MSYRNIHALIDYGRAAEFERMADYVQEADPYELGQDLCKMILFLFAAIHPSHRQLVIDNLLKAETNQEMVSFEEEAEGDEQNG